MSSVWRLSIKEASDFADLLEYNGGNADNIRDAIAELKNTGNSHNSLPVGSESDEAYLERMRNQSNTENGTDLECMICHYKFDHLISGTCEICFRNWVLSTKRG